MIEEIENTQDSGQEAKRDQERLLAEEKKRGEEYLMRLKYLQADFENYRKRAEKEMRDVEANSARDVAVKLLSVLDELELAMKPTATGENSELQAGVRMVYKKLAGVLVSFGLSRIDCVGKPFDPAFHEAVERVQGTGDEDLVVEEVRSGFMFRGQAIRPSMVKVELAMKNGDGKENEKDE